MIWRSTTLRGRLTLWYTGILTATFAVLGATSVLLLDRGLRQNVDDSLDSVANAIADSVQRPSFFGPELEDYLQSMLGPELAERPAPPFSPGITNASLPDADTLWCRSKQASALTQGANLPSRFRSRPSSIGRRSCRRATPAQRGTPENYHFNQVEGCHERLSSLG